MYETNKDCCKSFITVCVFLPTLLAEVILSLRCFLLFFTTFCSILDASTSSALPSFYVRRVIFSLSWGCFNNSALQNIEEGTERKWQRFYLQMMDGAEWQLLEKWRETNWKCGSSEYLFFFFLFPFSLAFLGGTGSYLISALQTRVQDVSNQRRKQSFAWYKTRFHK